MLLLEWISRILDLAKIPAKFVGAIALFSFLITFLPSGFLEVISLDQLRDKYGSYFGLAFLVSATLLFVELCALVYKKFRKIFFRRKLAKLIRCRLNELDQAERAVLREFFYFGFTHHKTSN